MSIADNNDSYKQNGQVWQEYSEEELRWWVKLLRKRAEMRTDEAKKAKDLRDASNYEEMLNIKLAE